MGYTLELSQKITVMKNIWNLSRIDNQNTPLGTIKQARLKLKEEVKCTLPDGNGLCFAIKARSAIELAASYDVTDERGAPVGVITKDFRGSLSRSTYHASSVHGAWKVTETSEVQAIIRRGVRLVGLPWVMRVQFSILNADGTQVGYVNRANMQIKDTYEIRVDDDALDWRLAAAIGVAVDAFMNR